MSSQVKIHWLWFFLSIFVYFLTNMLTAFIITAILPGNITLIAISGTFLGALIVVFVGKNSTMWDAAFGIVVFSGLASILNEGFVFSPLTLLLCLLFGFIGAWLGEAVKPKSKVVNQG